MNTQRTLARGAAALATVGLFACTREPAKDVVSAQTNLTSAEANARRSSVAFDEKQEAERAKADQQRAASLDEAQTKLTQANARLDVERQNVMESSKLQLERTGIRANALKEKSTLLSPGKKASFDALWNRYEVQQADAKNQVEDLGNVPTDAWITSRNTLNDSLSNLSKTVSKMNDLF